LKRLYDDSGHVQSTFEFHPRFRPIPEQAREGVADIEVIVEEGRQYAIGRIEFIGNGETSDQILRDALLVKEDEIFRPSRLNEGVKKLNGLGLFSPIDKDNDVEFTVDEEIPAVKIYIRVKPKNQVNPE
jgi:outer membrane protein assembly factor BamA